MSSESSPEPTPPQKASPWLGRLLFVGILILAAAFSASVTLFLENGGWASIEAFFTVTSSDRYPAVVYLNEDAVFSAVTVREHADSLSEVQHIAKSIGETIDSTIHRYNRHGSVVITTSTGVFVPAKDNITKAVIEEILRGNTN